MLVPRRTFCVLARFGLCQIVALAACARTPTPGPTATVRPTAGLITLVPTKATSAPVTGPTTLRVWLPPEFAPDVKTRGGRVLSEQLSAFESAHAGVAIEVRVKAASGPGGLMNALVTAANVAPTVLPNLIALRRDDLAAAAAGGLVAPLESLIPPEAMADYYPFAQSMGRYNGGWVGLPFAADARVMAYSTSRYPTPPLAWTDLVSGTLALPAAESTGLTLLNVYLALGGKLETSDGQLNLDAETLAQALESFQALQTAGALPQSTLDYADTATTWQAFRERRATLAVTSAQDFLAEYDSLADVAATLLPTSGPQSPPLALVDGWSWAIVNISPETSPQTAELLAWLMDPAEQADWTEAAMVLPTRGATLDAWQVKRLVPFVSDVVVHAQLQPTASALGVLGPPLRQALTDVLSGRATPFAAATRAAQTVRQP